MNRDITKLLIQEPPLQVLPSLAVAIGLNEAIVIQQLWYLLRDPAHGRRIAEKQWIFNTYEQWRVTYFPFWSVETIKRTFTSLKTKRLIECCQPEGRISRRKYYRISEQGITECADQVKMTSSSGSNRPLPSTKTTVHRSLKESKETTPAEIAHSFEEFEPVWKPIRGTKKEQLARIQPTEDYPSEPEFDDFISELVLDEIAMGKRGDLYRDLCLCKWHHWNGRRWNPIRDWRKYISALNDKIADATTGHFRR